VLQHVRSGAYREGPLGDDLVDAAVRAVGGYRFLATSREDQLGYVEKRFAEHFATIEDRQQVRRGVPHLAPPTPHLMLESEEELVETDAEFSGEGECDD
jgi:hypothetical protein